MILRGLSESEVAEKISLGQVNEQKVKPITNGSIIKKHTITLFNIIIFSLALVCIIAGQLKNAIFIFIAVFNAIIAIINDIRAKNTVEELQLVAEKHATVLRDDKEIEIENTAIVLGDILHIRSGDQIIVDSELVDGYLEVNESFVTGESDTVKKSPGDRLMSGSFVVAGSCYARVVAVGADNMTNKILLSAKTIKEERSELFTMMQRIVKYVSFALIPVGIFLFLNQLEQAEGDTSTAIASTVSALVAMIPEGLMLLTSSVLALATIRLSQKRVLVSDLYSIETLAKVDTICLDKTGTITTGDLRIECIIPVSGSTEAELSSAVSSILGHLTDNNSTYRALEDKFPKDTDRDALNITPFSSERKYSGVDFGDFGYYMGAYEFLTENKKYQKEEQGYASEYRVITVIRREGKKDKILGFILLSDEIRTNAKNLIKYFDENDVKVKVISGDNLPTIVKICSAVDIDSSRAIDLSTQKNPDWDQIVEDYDIFARVRPEEKRNLIRALEARGHTVAMTGDGVNDVLALREADCGISIGSASDAARKVSKLILLSDDFSAIPEIIKEGRRTINNVTRSSTLFLTKTIYASVLSVCFIFLPFIYPFTPVEMALLNVVTIGAPSFILALEPNFERKKVSFFVNMLRFSLPTALSVVISIIALSITAGFIGIEELELYTFSAFIVITIGFLLIRKISLPLNTNRKTLLIFLIITVLSCYFTPLLRRFYGLAILPFLHYLLLALFIVLSAVIFIYSAKYTNILIDRHYEKKLTKEQIK